MVEKGTGLLVIISLVHTEKALKCFVSFLKKKKKPISASEAKVNPSADSAGTRFELRELSAEHIPVPPVHNQSGSRYGRQTADR